MYEHVSNFKENKNSIIAVAQKRSAVSRSLELVDNRPDTIMQRQSSPMSNKVSPSQLTPVIQKASSSVVQFERTVTNRMKRNMQTSLTRMFGGPFTRYVIDQESGTTFNDGAPNYTTGHHGVKVTDTVTGREYRCDFHQDGAYYTRG